MIYPILKWVMRNNCFGGRGGGEEEGGLCAIAHVKWQKPNMSHPKVLAYLIHPKDNANSLALCSVKELKFILDKIP
jgi:hypothetical protein